MENGLPINDDNSEYVETGYSVSDETRDNTVWDTEVNGGAISKKILIICIVIVSLVFMLR